jgi:hypothetical protein
MKLTVANFSQKCLFALALISTQYICAMQQPGQQLINILQLPSDVRGLIFDAVIAGSKDYNEALKSVRALRATCQTFNRDFKAKYSDENKLVNKLAAGLNLRNNDEILEEAKQMFSRPPFSSLQTWIAHKKYHSKSSKRA